MKGVETRIECDVSIPFHTEIKMIFKKLNRLIRCVSPRFSYHSQRICTLVNLCNIECENGTRIYIFHIGPDQNRFYFYPHNFYCCFFVCLLRRQNGKLAVLKINWLVDRAFLGRACGIVPRQVTPTVEGHS